MHQPVMCCARIALQPEGINEKMVYLFHGGFFLRVQTWEKAIKKETV